MFIFGVILDPIALLNQSYFIKAFYLWHRIRFQLFQYWMMRRLGHPIFSESCPNWQLLIVKLQKPDLDWNWDSKPDPHDRKWLLTDGRFELTRETRHKYPMPLLQPSLLIRLQPNWKNKNTLLMWMYRYMYKFGKFREIDFTEKCMLTTYHENWAGRGLVNVLKFLYLVVS